MSKVIGVDIGYGRTKVYDGERRDNFASAVSSQVAAEATFESHLQPFFVHDRAYIAGEDAQIHARTVEDTRNESFLCSGGWFALLAHALRGAGYDPDCEGAVIAIGLPPGMCGPDRYRQVLRTVKETSVLDRSSGMAYRFARTRVIIIPQGVGIYYYYHMTSPEAADQKVAIADIGHQTLDFVFVSQGRYVEHARETRPAGVGREYDHLMQLAQAMPGRGPLTRAEIVSGIADGTLFDENHENYVKGAREHLEGYARNVFSTIDSYVASLPAKPDVIIAGGGGARLLFAMRSKPGYRLSIAAEAELANAMGYWHYATMLAG
jgi:hypothetical protein